MTSDAGAAPARDLTALPIVNDSTAEVRLRFTPVESGSDWRLDDVYVDPWKGR